MSRKIEQPREDEYGHEIHPAWVVVGAYRGTVSPPGAALFDSDIRHQHVITVRVSEARRKRNLHRDWIGDVKPIVEFTMSEAQWASFVSSMNSGSGVPATLGYREGKSVPGVPYDPRLQASLDEVRGAAERAQADVLVAFREYQEHKTAGNLRSLQAAIENMPANISFAGEQLSEHAENVVQRAKADIEAFVVNKAQQLGLDPGELDGSPALTSGEESP
jgi:hypothetical protein